MLFWIFMLLADLLMPLTMVVFGKRFMTRPPENISASFGYRTAMSMRNRDTWDFAHKYFGKLWFKCGSVLIPLSVLPLMFVFNRGVNTIGAVGGIVCLVQFIPAIGAVIPTEAALKRTFDTNGIRR